MDDVHPHPVARSGDGSLTALGYLQIGTGTLTIVMSLMAFAQAMLNHAELLDPMRVFGLSTGFLNQSIATYVSLQLSLGWIAGALQLAAGICCLHDRRPRFVTAASVVSLCNFPHGTMAAILMLQSMRAARSAMRPSSPHS